MDRLVIPELAGKVCLVSGGGAGIGFAITEAFARQGAVAVMVDIDTTHLEASTDALAGHGLAVHPIHADVTREDDVARIVDEIRERFGRLHVLVNNVGNSFGSVRPFEETDPEEWDRLYFANLRHVFSLTQQALPLMRRRDGAGGSIINVSTIEAHRGFPLGVAYSAFKSALTGFTKSLGVELGPAGIRVNTIAPETTRTASIPISNWLAAEEEDRIAAWVPLGRFGVPSDAAGCALFLASDLASWITGTVIHLDGGCLAAGGWVRTPAGRWTHRPTITGTSWPPPLSSRRGTGNDSIPSPHPDRSPCV